MFDNNTKSLEQKLLSVDNENELNTIDINKKKIKTDFFLDNAIVAAGEYGLYNMLNILFLSMVWIIIPSIPIMLPYFRMMPNFVCQNADLTERQCTIQEVCDNTISKINIHSPLKTWATDFNLYCEKSIYFGILGSLYFFGILIGNLFIAKFTDFYGRKPVLIVYLILYLFTSILTIFAWTYYVFLIVSFIVGVIYSGTSMCAFVLNYESSSKKMKSTFSTILSMSYGMGAIIHILIFYYYKNWIITVTITTILTIVLLIFTFHLQESPEFLFVKGRYDEMVQVLKYIAIMNGKQTELNEYLKNSTLNKLKKVSKKDLKYKHEVKEDKVYGVLDIMFLKDQRFILLIMAFNWFVMTLTFYGINFNVSNFGTDPYSTGILVYLSETISQWLCLYFINTYGFRLTLSGSYLIAAICLIAINLLDNEYFLSKICLIFVAKFGISGVNISNYIFTAELFPFMIRVASMSFCSLMSRFGGMTGTLIIEVNSYSMLLFGSLCLIVSCILYKNQQLKNMEQLN